LLIHDAITLKGGDMKNVTIGSGEVVTQEKFIEINSGGTDELTEFLATKDDVWTLARAIGREILGKEWAMSQCSGGRDIQERLYLGARLNRVVDFMPELVDSIEENLRVGRAKIKIDESWSGPAPKDAGCPTCFSPLDRQQIYFDSRQCCTIRTTSDGGWERGELTASPYTDEMEWISFYCPDCKNQYYTLHPRNADEVAAWAFEQQKKEESSCVTYPPHH
jgi:hypothetical protein